MSRSSERNVQDNQESWGCVTCDLDARHAMINCCDKHSSKNSRFWYGQFWKPNLETHMHQHPSLIATLNQNATQAMIIDLRPIVRWTDLANTSPVRRWDTDESLKTSFAIYNRLGPLPSITKCGHTCRPTRRSTPASLANQPERANQVPWRV